MARRWCPMTALRRRRSRARSASPPPACCSHWWWRRCSRCCRSRQPSASHSRFFPSLRIAIAAPASEAARLLCLPDCLTSRTRGRIRGRAMACRRGKCLTGPYCRQACLPFSSPHRPWRIIQAASAASKRPEPSPPSPATPLEQGHAAISFFYEYIKLGGLSDAALAAAAGRHEHVHSIGTIQSPTIVGGLGLTNDLSVYLSLPYVLRT